MISFSHFSKALVTYLTCFALILPYPVSVVAQDAAQDSPMDSLLSLISNASTYGMFVNRDEYSALREEVLARAFIEGSEAPSQEEAQELLQALDSVEIKRKIWLERLIKKIEDLRARQGSEILQAVDLVELSKACGQLDELTVKPIRNLFESLIAGRAASEQELEAVGDAGAERNECQAQLDRFLAAVAEHAENLQKELDVLRSQIEQKKRECDALPSATDAEKSATVACAVDLTVLNDRLKEVQEKYDETRETEAGGKDFKIALGILAIIGGTVAAAYGDANMAIGLWSIGAELINSADDKEMETIEKTRSAGVTRIIEGASSATEAEVNRLADTLKERGLEPVEYTNDASGFSVSIFQGDDIIEIYLTSVKQADGTTLPQLIASMTSENTDIVANNRGFDDFKIIRFANVDGSLFGERNAVSMSVRGTLGDPVEPVEFSVSETSPGSKQFVITIAE